MAYKLYINKIAKNVLPLWEMVSHTQKYSELTLGYDQGSLLVLRVPYVVDRINQIGHVQGKCLSFCTISLAHLCACVCILTLP